MFEIFKMVLLLSGLGTGMILILLLIKPFSVKKFPARWQYFVWLMVTICMLVPVWKWIPVTNVQKPAPRITVGPIDNDGTEKHPEETPIVIIEDIPMEYREISFSRSKSIRIYDLIAYIWFGGMCTFLLLAFGNYFSFLIQKRAGSFEWKKNQIFDEIKDELRIRRKIRVRISNDTASPMLVGTFFPIIYIPEKNLDESVQRMVFRHELIHYKYGDLLYKWLTLFVNAVHWFNPFAYLLSANVSQACEVACDMAVIRDMSDDEQKLYMNTILNLIEQENHKGA